MTEEKASGIMDSSPGMEADGDGEEEEEGEVTLRALGDLEFLTQDVDTSGTMIFDACNGFNELRHLAMMWTVRHHWPAGARFAFN